MKMDIPWVKLIRSSYYGDDSLPDQKIKGSFWWKDIVKLLDTYKNLASVKVVGVLPPCPPRDTPEVVSCR
jgi:hypothetical protein